MAITENDLTAVAQELGITLQRTRKASKVAWELTKDGHTTVIQGNSATLDVLNFMRVTQGESEVPDYTLYAEPIKVRAGIFTSPKACTQVMMSVCNDPTQTADDILEDMKSKGQNVRKDTIAVMMSEIRKTLRYLQSQGRLLVS